MDLRGSPDNEGLIGALIELHAIVARGISEGHKVWLDIRAWNIKYASDQAAISTIKVIEAETAKVLQGYQLGDIGGMLNPDPLRLWQERGSSEKAGIDSISLADRSRYSEKALFDARARVLSFQIKAICETGKPRAELAFVLHTAGLTLQDIPVDLHASAQTLSSFLRSNSPFGVPEIIKMQALSLNAKKGADARHAKHSELKEYAIGLYRSVPGKYSSLRQAAKAITPHVAEYAKRIGAPLSADNAQRTVYDWLRRHDKS